MPYPRPILAAAALLSVAVSVPAEAARDASASVPVSSGYEIVVMEVAGCAYCPLFRSTILPVYLATPRAKSVPVRFQDLNADGADRVALKEPIKVVPTAVLVHGNSEIGRISGYVAPDAFPRMVSDLMLGRN